MSAPEKKTMKPGMPPGRPTGPSLFGLLKPYRPLIATLVLMTIAGNGLNLIVPKLIARTIDTYARQQLVLTTFIVEFFAVASGIFLFGYLQTVVQVYAS